METRVVADMRWIWPIAAAAAFAVGTLVLLLVSGYTRPNYRGAVEPSRAELPGGFDPVPHFDDVRSELEFRGAECLHNAAQPYELHRQCASVQ